MSLEKPGAIVKVDESMVCVSQNVVTKKRSVAIRMCLDTLPLNLPVKRERYPLPIQDNLQLQLSHMK